MQFSAFTSSAKIKLVFFKIRAIRFYDQTRKKSSECSMSASTRSTASVFWVSVKKLSLSVARKSHWAISSLPCLAVMADSISILMWKIRKESYFYWIVIKIWVWESASKLPFTNLHTHTDILYGRIDYSLSITTQYSITMVFKIRNREVWTARLLCWWAICWA